MQISNRNHEKALVYQILEIFQFNTLHPNAISTILKLLQINTKVDKDNLIEIIINRIIDIYDQHKDHYQRYINNKRSTQIDADAKEYLNKILKYYHQKKSTQQYQKNNININPIPINPYLYNTSISDIQQFQRTIYQIFKSSFPQGIPQFNNPYQYSNMPYNPFYQQFPTSNYAPCRFTNNQNSYNPTLVQTASKNESFGYYHPPQIVNPKIVPNKVKSFREMITDNNVFTSNTKLLQGKKKITKQPTTKASLLQEIFKQQKRPEPIRQKYLSEGLTQYKKNDKTLINQINLQSQSISNNKRAIEVNTMEKQPNNTPKNSTQSIIEVQQNQQFMGEIINQQFFKCRCHGKSSKLQCFICQECNKKYHLQCYRIKQQRDIPNKCLECNLKSLDQFHQVISVIQIAYIEKINKNPFHLEIPFSQFQQFLENQSQFSDIEIRCTNINGSPCVQNLWPDNSVLKINDEEKNEFIALSINSSLKKRKDSPVSIGKIIRKQQKNRNVNINIFVKNFGTYQGKTLRVSNKHPYLLAIYYIKKYDVQQLYQKIVGHPLNYLQNFIPKLFNDESNQIEIQEIKVTLIDSFTLNPIDIPARGQQCKHGQCFDLKTFLSFMYICKNRYWRCPICKKICRKLIIDNDILKLIEVLKDKSLPKEISFTKNNQCTYLYEKQQLEEKPDNQINRKTKQINKNKSISQSSNSKENLNQKNSQKDRSQEQEIGQ